MKMTTKEDYPKLYDLYTQLNAIFGEFGIIHELNRHQHAINKPSGNDPGCCYACGLYDENMNKVPINHYKEAYECMENLIRRISDIEEYIRSGPRDT